MPNSPYRTQDLFGQDHHLTDEGMALFVDALRFGHVEDLPPEIRIHVGECLECKMEIAELDQATQDLDYSNVKDNPFEAQPKKRSEMRGRFHFFFRVAAILIAAVGIGSLLLFELSERHESAGLTASREKQLDTNYGRSTSGEIGKLSRQESIAANFTPLARLEYALGSNLRSGTIRLISPRNGDTVQSPLIFRWETRVTGKVLFQLVTNSDSLLESHYVLGQHVRIERTLPPGLYYWKLEKAGDLMSVGRFFIYADSRVKGF